MRKRTSIASLLVVFGPQVSLQCVIVIPNHIYVLAFCGTIVFISVQRTFDRIFYMQTLKTLINTP